MKKKKKKYVVVVKSECDVFSSLAKAEEQAKSEAECCDTPYVVAELVCEYTACNVARRVPEKG